MPEHTEITPEQRQQYLEAILKDERGNDFVGEYGPMPASGAIHSMATAFLMGDKIPLYFDMQRYDAAPAETKAILFGRHPSHVKNVESYLRSNSPGGRQTGLPKSDRNIAIPLLTQIYHLLNPQQPDAQKHRLAIEQAFEIFGFGKIPEYSAVLYQTPAADIKNIIQTEIDKYGASH